MRRCALAAIVLVCSAVSAAAQSPQQATDVTAADIRAVLKNAPPDGVSDQQIKVADLGKYNVAVGVLHRSAKAKQTSISHAQVTEIYYVLDGAGTFVTGGRITDAAPAPADGTTVKILVGPSTSGSGIEQGRSRHLGPGDVVVVPAGVPHWFSAIEKDLDYMVFRVDADHVLPAGYVNPAVGK